MSTRAASHHLSERTGWALRVAVALVAGVAAISWLVGAIAHVDDGYRVDHVAGTWMALAAYANDGVLYPPLYDGETFGGTRFMPLPIVLQAGAARLTGEYLVSAKLISGVLFVALVVLTFALIRRRSSSLVAAALTSTLLVTGTGLVASTSVRNDTLPLLLQLGAIALIARSTSRATVVTAGLLCSLAVLGKLSAVWGLVAIVVWLARSDRRRVVEYLAMVSAGVALGLLVFQIASDGRMDDNVLGLARTSSDRLGSVHDEIARLRLIGREGLGPLAFLPVVALLATGWAARCRRLTIYHVAFLAAALVTAVVLLDPGAYINHLLDVQVLSLLVLGELVGSRRVSRERSWVLAAGVVAILLGSLAAYHENVRIQDDVHVLAHGTAARDRVPRLDGVVGEDDLLLSEDPFVPVSRGQRPVILDPYMVVGLLRSHPDWRRDLVERIEDTEFDKIVLLYRPDTAPEWYERVHLGRDVVGAIERSYRPERVVDERWIYVPR